MLDAAEVIQLIGQGGSDHLVSLRVNKTRRASGRLDGTGLAVRIIKLPATAATD